MYTTPEMWQDNLIDNEKFRGKKKETKTKRKISESTQKKKDHQSGRPKTWY